MSVQDEAFTNEVNLRASQKATALLATLPLDEKRAIRDRAEARFKKHETQKKWIIAICCLALFPIIFVLVGIPMLIKLTKNGDSTSDWPRAWNKKWWNTLSDKDKATWQLTYELSEEVKEKLLTEQKEIKVPSRFNFNYNKCVKFLTGETTNKYLLLDGEGGKFVLKDEWNYSKVYRFSDLLGYDIYENGHSVVQGNAGEALVGGLFFGVGGAIVGASMPQEVNEHCNDLWLILHLNDINASHKKIVYLQNDSIAKSSDKYRIARDNLQEISSVLEFVLNNKREADKKTKDSSNDFENLRELKKLLDEGVLTQEEFDAKKKQLLNL